MDIKKLESSLKMEKFYFSHCSVERKENIGDSNPKMDIKRYVSEIEEHTSGALTFLTYLWCFFKTIIT